MAKMTKCKTCGADIAKSARVCPKCGAKKKNHKVLGVLLVIVGIAFFINGFSDFDTSRSSDNNTPQNTEDLHASNNTDDGPDSSDTFSDEQSTSENDPAISMEEFNAISTGMTYDEVVDIIGSDGEVLSEVDLDIGEEFKTIMYMWKGEGALGANANITFQDGKVTSKAQIGLK